MPVGDRDYVRGKHPPACTCKECTDRRLRKFTGRNSDDKTPPRIKPPFFSQTMGGKPLRLLWRKIPPSIHKLFLSLLVIAGLVDIVRRGYTLFTQQADPIKNTIVFLVEVGLWIWIVTILRNRRYRYRKPKFKLVLTAVIAITLVCAFAGIEPLSSYKDNLSNSISDYLEEQQTAREAAKVAEEEARVKAEASAKAEAERKAEEEAQAEEERVIQEVLNAESLAFELINKERMLNGLMSTKWDDELYKLSKAHTQKMADKGELFHTPLGASYGENAWGGFGYHRYSSEELAKVIVNSWMSSPLHKAWILNKSFGTSVVSIVVTPTGQYASWAFWAREIGEGPPLIRKISDEWQRETGGKVPWIEWLYMKGYLG